MEPLSLVVDEVSLEGLDGITIPSLWIRLEDRKPKFPLKLDDCTKEFIWSSLVHNDELTFYELPKDRDNVELDDRYKDIDPETGIETKEVFETKTDAYPVHIILENKNGIQGSCMYFKERKDVTKHIRSQSKTPLINLDDALKRYGQKLVVVASQILRFRTLIGTESDPDLKLNDDSYCVLERIGRARWQGELQRDLHVCSFKIDARKLHYMRKSLVRYGLITIQSHVTRLRETKQQQHSVLLLLKRFHVNRRTKYDILMERVSTFLQSTPSHFSTLVTLREHLNVDDGSFKRLYQYMRAAKLVDFCRVPLEELDPSSGPCKNKRGEKLQVRCLKMIKPLSKKGVADDDDDDDDDEDDDEDESAATRETFTSEGRVMERDVLSQAYDFILASGTKGLSQRTLGCKMNIGKLESRMICRKLERECVIKGFMEDVGRQRVTKYISHKYVDVSNKLQLFAKEQERNKLLCSSAPLPLNCAPPSPKTPSTSKPSKKGKGKTPAAKEKQHETGVEKDVAMCAGKEEKTADKGSDEDESQGRETMDKKSDVTINQTQTESAVVEAGAAECESSALNESSTSIDSVPCTEQASTDKDTLDSSPIIPVDQSEAGSVTAATKIVLVKDILPARLVSNRNKSKNSLDRTHATYRLLRRKNMIVEAVQNAQVIDGLFPLQKMINDKEREDGVSSKCCKKTILRLVQALSREGLLKFYTTTVIQDGVSKKVEMVAHPSVQPTDEIVQRLIDQVRFKISSSCSAGRQVDEKNNDQRKASAETESKDQSNKANKKQTSKEKKFAPTTVKGLGKSFGFQPKMHRLRAVHNFLWYMIYGHPLRNCSHSRSHSPVDFSTSESNTTTESSDTSQSITQSSEAAATSSVKPAKRGVASLDPTSSADEDDDAVSSGHRQPEMTVYQNEESWKKYIPPIHVNKDFGSGWAMVGDLLLCLPLSVFIQVIQINYQVEGLEEYLNDAEKQHYLVRRLPSKMRRQLLYKRKYIFNFHENLQKLAYMGLIQFGPVEKFKDKDQVYVYLKRNATIVDTTNAEPHYWLVTESLDKPFERRPYTFNTAEDTENYWFDLMCVCLNTPLGVIRSKRYITEEEAVPSFVRDRSVFAGLAYLLKGSRDVCDDGSIPGDGKGAGGLDSEFFAHLKRNWLWTNHLLSVKTRQRGTDANEAKMRLKSLNKTALRIVLKAGGSATPRYVTAKKMLITEENVEVAVEPASRNQQVVGGKQQKRKKTKKEVVKAPRKKRKEPKKRTPAHDEADHQALKLMTRQRVYWSVSEDSLMMLCSVASHLLNSKLKRYFVPYCVVRDLLHAEFDKSKDKTSLAVGRRTRYILKNPQTLLNYRICLAEAYQDKHLMRLLDENNPVDPDKPEDCSKSFLEYTKLLRQKFSSAANPSKSILPDTKQQLFSRFKICAIDSGKQVLWKDKINCTEDIHAIVLGNLIQSTLAMTNSQMKSSRSFQTFHIYSKYNQELLCQVFILYRKKGLVNRRRVSQTFGPKMNRALPILPMSYQLSQSYFRCFSFRFPHTLCTDTFRFLRILLNSGAGDDRPFTSFYHETENRSGDGEALESKKTSRKKGKKESGATTEPDCTKEDDNNQSKETEGDPKIMDVDNETTGPQMVPDKPKNLDDCLTSGSTREETDCYKAEPPGESISTASPGPDGPLDVSNLVQFSLGFPGGACSAALSLMTLGLVSVHMSVPKQMVVVDSTLVDNDVVKSMAALEDEDDDDDDGEECEGRKRMEVKAHQASHTNYLMMRGYCAPGIVKLRNLNTTDNIVVESCIMRLQLRNTPAHHMFSVESSPLLDLSKCGPSLLPPFLTSTIGPYASSQEENDGHLIEQKGYTHQDTEVCAQIRRSLSEAGDKGIDVDDFMEAHRDLKEPQSGRTRSLQQYMQDLAEEGEVLKVGAVGARWVLTQHAQPWLLTIQSNHWSPSRLTHQGLPIVKNPHSIPFMRKRNRRGAQEDEPPAKNASLDENQVKNPGNENTSEKVNEEEELEKQKEGAAEERGEQEEGMKTQPEKEEEEEEEGKMPTETRQRKRPMRLRKDSLSERSCCDSREHANLSNTGKVSFISRPWRMVDGKLNRQVCKGMMEAVLYHIMSHPGIMQGTLLQHYKDVLQPMATLDLVQALIDMGCVIRKTLQRAPKPSLFRRYTHQIKSKSEVKSEEPDTVFYEPTISCCLRLSQALPNERYWNSETPLQGSG